MTLTEVISQRSNCSKHNKVKFTQCRVYSALFHNDKSTSQMLLGMTRCRAGAGRMGMLSKDEVLAKGGGGGVDNRLSSEMKSL